MNAFNDVPNLRTLNLTGNRLTSLHKDVFDPLTNLTFLDLERNRLTSLREDTFENLTKLEELYLNHNELTTLHEDTFDGLASVTGLGLRFNNLSRLPSNLFEDTVNLEWLFLEENNLTSLPTGIFDGLSVLAQLRLHNNDLTALPPGIFRDTDLYVLRLDGNNLSSLRRDTFYGLTWLNTLELGDNNLTSLPAGIFRDQGGSDEIVELGLAELYLHHNGLSSPHPDLFDGLARLGLLDLGGNGITSPHQDLFDGLENLQWLYLDGNDITSPHRDLLDGRTALKELDLNDNRISSLPAGFFNSATALENLDLGCNSLTALDLSEFDPFAGTLYALDISGNSFTAPPTEAELLARFTNLEDLHLGADVDCGALANPFLSGITINTGTIDFTPPSGTDARSVQFEFIATIGHDVPYVDIRPTPWAPGATVHYPNPGRSPEVDLEEDVYTLFDQAPDIPGIQLWGGIHHTNEINFEVISPDGRHVRDYTIFLHREPSGSGVARLESLELSGLTLTPAFDGHTFHYRAEVPRGVAQTTITATPVDPDAVVTFRHNGAADADGVVDLAYGSNVIWVNVRSGLNMAHYAIAATRHNNWNLSGSPGVVSIDLSWDKHYRHSEIDRYMVYMGPAGAGVDEMSDAARPAKSEVTVVGDRVSWTLTNDGTQAGNNLWPDTEYKVYVSGCFQDDCYGEATFDSNVITVRTRPSTRDYAVRDLRSEDIFHRSYMLKWDAPTSTPYPVDYYEIIRYDSNDDVIQTDRFSGTELNPTAEPASIIRLGVRAVLENREPGATERITVTTNYPAQGDPTITGEARVGQTLTGDASRVRDTDGMTNADLTYEWLISPPGGPGSSYQTSEPTYVVREEDTGKTIEFRVSFTDDRGVREERTSQPTAAVNPVDRDLVWSATLNTKSISSGLLFGCNNASYGKECSNTSVLSDNEFTYNSVNFTITHIHWQPSLQLLVLHFVQTSALLQPLTLYVDGVPLAVADGNTTLDPQEASWENTSFTWTANQSVHLWLAPSTAGSGAPGKLLAPDNLEAAGHADRVELDMGRGERGHQLPGAAQGRDGCRPRPARRFLNQLLHRQRRDIRPELLVQGEGGERFRQQRGVAVCYGHSPAAETFATHQPGGHRRGWLGDPDLGSAERRQRRR